MWKQRGNAPENKAADEAEGWWDKGQESHEQWSHRKDRENYSFKEKKKGKYNFYIINKKEVREMKIRKLENKRIHTFGSVQFSP